MDIRSWIETKVLPFLKSHMEDLKNGNKFICSFEPFEAIASLNIKNFIENSNRKFVLDFTCKFDRCIVAILMELLFLRAIHQDEYTHLGCSADGDDECYYFFLCSMISEDIADDFLLPTGD